MALLYDVIILSSGTVASHPVGTALLLLWATAGGVVIPLLCAFAGGTQVCVVTDQTLRIEPLWHSRLTGLLTPLSIGVFCIFPAISMFIITTHGWAVGLSRTILPGLFAGSGCVVAAMLMVRQGMTMGRHVPLSALELHPDIDGEDLLWLDQDLIGWPEYDLVVCRREITFPSWALRIASEAAMRPEHASTGK